MAVTNFLPTGASADTSAVFVLGTGGAATLVGAARPGPGSAPYWRVFLQRQMSDGAWETVGQLSWERPLLTIYGEGAWRLLRQAGAPCLVDGAIA